MRKGLKVGVLLSTSVCLGGVMLLRLSDAQGPGAPAPPDRGRRTISRPDFEEYRRRMSEARTVEERTAIIRELSAQRSSSRGFSSSGFSSGGFPASSGTTQPAPATKEKTTPSSPEDEYPGDGPAIDVEILFIELVADKDGPVKFTGTLAEVEKKLADLKTGGKIVSVSRISTSAVDANKSTSQIGNTQAVFRGASAGGFGGRTSASRVYSSAMVGTLFTVIPFIEDTGAISLKLEIQKSWLQGNTGSSAEPGESTSSPTTNTVTIKNSVRVRNGRVATVSSSTQQEKGGSTQLVTLVTAKLAEGEKIPASLKGGQGVRTAKVSPKDMKTALELIKQLAGDNAVSVDYDPVAQILILRGEAKLVGDLATAVQAYLAQAKAVEEKPTEKTAPKTSK